MPSEDLVLQYISELRAIRATGSATHETSYYPPLARLLNAVGENRKPPVLFSTQVRDSGAGIPDGGFFPQRSRSRRNTEPEPLQNPERGVAEIKPAEYDLEALVRDEQTIRYLRHYGLVFITNFRQFRLLKLNPAGQVETIESYTFADSATDLWNRPLAHFACHKNLLPDFLARVMVYKAPLVQPKDVAWILASYAREARARAEDHPLGSFDVVKDALENSLGMKFEGEKGLHFFRSTLVQTLFYGIFSAWILWRRTPEGRVPGAQFDWRTSAYHLRVPVLRRLFNEVAEPGALNSIQIQEILALAGEVLNRVQPGFFEIFREEDAVAYFYEPFLEAFDPLLRKELGVWYTPREIVEYMVERVDRLLRTELHQPLGLASPAVRILDPCCGTGAYLTAVLHKIHRTLLEQAGDDTDLVATEVRKAALTRVFGFEIMPAPFVIAHLQLASLLERAKAPLADEHRAGVYLTNALTGWVPAQYPNTMFAEFRQEREDSEHIKQEDTILVILGNPPYNGFPGISKIDEERDLTEAYKHTMEGLPAPDGHGLNELYVRFFRIAERRIMQNAGGAGIVCFISNYSWLYGSSHPTMRGEYLRSFAEIFIDNLNGDKYRNGKTTPDGKPDPSAFSTPLNREGIQVGTAISTLIRTTAQHGQAQLRIRDIWGKNKLAQLAQETRGECSATYDDLSPQPVLGCQFAHRVFGSAYTEWPRLPELLPLSFPGPKTSRDFLVIDIDRERLKERMKKYFDPSIDHEQFRQTLPEAMEDGYMYNAKEIREALQNRGFRDWELLPYCYRPFDLRWIYWEPETSLLRRKVEDYVGQMVGATSWIEARQRESGEAFSRGTITRSLADNFGNGYSNFFPAQVIEIGGPLLPSAQIRPNLSRTAEIYLESLQASKLDLFPHALAVIHSPAYRDENSGALLGDYPRIPLPATSVLLAHSAQTGRRLAELLDAESSVNLSAEWSFLATIKLPPQANLDEALKLIADWGRRGQGTTVMPSRGLCREREWTDVEREKLATLAAAQSLTLEDAHALLGQTCIDVHLNGDAWWSAIPANVWEYTLGGYQVLKKWLSYREYTLLGRALKPEESAWFAQVVRRIAAILLMGPALDASYRAIVPSARGLSAR